MWLSGLSASQQIKASLFVPSQGSSPGCGPDPQLGACKKLPLVDISFPLSPSLPFSLKNKEIDKIFLKNEENEKVEKF